MSNDGPWQEEPPRSFEQLVLRALMQSLAPRGRLEAAREEGSSLFDEKRIVQSAVAYLHCHGQLIARLAIVASTREELKVRMPRALSIVPAWMEAHVYGVEVITPRLYARGAAQLLGEHRTAIERIVAEQVLEPEPIEEILVEAPVPEGGEDEGEREMIDGVGNAGNAHARALVEIARDLDQQLARYLDQ